MSPRKLIAKSEHLGYVMNSKYVLSLLKEFGLIEEIRPYVAQRLLMALYKMNTECSILFVGTKHDTSDCC